MAVREKSSMEDKLSKSGFIPHIWKTMIIPTTTLDSVGGHHLEGSGIPRYPNTWSSTKGSSLRVSEGVKNIKSVCFHSLAYSLLIAYVSHPIHGGYITMWELHTLPVI